MAQFGQSFLIQPEACQRSLLRTCSSQMKAGGTRGAIDAESERSQAFDVSEAQGEGMDQPNGA